MHTSGNAGAPLAPEAARMAALPGKVVATIGLEEVY
jgi:hypothetical protein